MYIMISRDRKMGFQFETTMARSVLPITDTPDYISPESLHFNAMYSIINGMSWITEKLAGRVFFMFSMSQEIELGQRWSIRWYFDLDRKFKRGRCLSVINWQRRWHTHLPMNQWQEVNRTMCEWNWSIKFNKSEVNQIPVKCFQVSLE